MADIKGWVTKKVGPLPLWAYVVIGAGGVFLLTRKRGGEAGAGEFAVRDPIAALPVGGYSAGMPGSSETPTGASPGERPDFTPVLQSLANIAAEVRALRPVNPTAGSSALPQTTTSAGPAPISIVQTPTIVSRLPLVSAITGGQDRISSPSIVNPTLGQTPTVSKPAVIDVTPVPAKEAAAPLTTTQASPVQAAVAKITDVVKGVADAILPTAQTLAAQPAGGWTAPPVFQQVSPTKVLDATTSSGGAIGVVNPANRLLGYSDAQGNLWPDYAPGRVAIWR